MSIHGVYQNSIPDSILNGPAILDGSRNITLTSIAGMLHDGSRSQEELVEDLHRVNKARCEPPLARREE